MIRALHFVALLAVTLGLSACQQEEDEDAPKPVAVQVAPTMPAGNDDLAWKEYLGKVVGQNMAGVTDRVFPYYLPANSGEPTPGDLENRSQYDRQLDNVLAVVQRTVLPGNMMAFGSPDSSKMADLIVAAFAGAKADALKGSQVLFIGKPEDSARVQPAVEAAGAKYIFVEAK